MAHRALIAPFYCACICAVSSMSSTAHADQSPPTATKSAELPQEIVASANTRITHSCKLVLPARALIDADNNGVIQIEGDDITVDLGGQALVGAELMTPRDEMTGIGIRVHGKHVTVRNGTVTGFRIGISAAGCDDAVFEGLEFTRNFSQRLGSNLEREDPKDWLWPQKNDDGQWLSMYGAAIAVSDAQRIVIKDVRVRQGQNGFVLSRVSNAQVYNCDASFLSGWGIALWRSCSNTICRNSFDFCIRGYSHNVYNRGQDSAGILCFEQSSDNKIMLNSATHCGDGFFSFAGSEALGEIPRANHGASADGPNWNLGQGCNRNLIALNDFSDAAAHGLETTFSFDNRIYRNRFDRDAICGIWGGYSQRLEIRGNLFRANGDAGRGAENGGINIEHGRDVVIADNTFSSNTVGVRLWWDEDSKLAELPWAKANGVSSAGNIVIRNTFEHDKIGIFVRASQGTVMGSNTMKDVGVEIDSDETSRASHGTQTTLPPCDSSEVTSLQKTLPGTANAVDVVDGLPISNRNQLVGRAAIIVGEFGPFDFVAPMVIREPSPANVNLWKLLGSQPIKFLQANQGQSDLRTSIELDTNIATVNTETLGVVTNYELAIFWGVAPDQVQRVQGTLLSTNWRVDVFTLPTPSTPGAIPNPAIIEQPPPDAYRVYVESLTFPFGMGGPDAVKLMPTSPTVPKDNFGIRATTTFTVSAGDWIVQTESDDGIRVLLDGKILIDHWNRHGTAIDQGRFTINKARDVTMTVLYFELDGEAKLDLRILAAPSISESLKGIAP